ncbi:NAD-dependent epimerase/dehydratase family protein [Paenibacillus sp. Marseille-Q4541]|uniref:NAD-dependent epimerase/dehydratase family protein n=1 Tax=Paenibacillus sp. Marseille-Q4541 TaxID=2831522 RepID=UPI001BAA6D3E|nr:NAD-dependent epimerase/dehydratase family protein [Paenibacillus sp. Marseille-Q4541]
MDTSGLRDKIVLVTGASGFTGRHAVQLLSDCGAKVSAVVRMISADLFPNQVNVHLCNLTDRHAVNHLLSIVKPDYILHLAGQNSVPASWNDPVSTIEMNVMSPLYLLDAMRALPECRAVIVGSRLKYVPIPDVPLSPPHPYSLSKYIEELVAVSFSALYDQQVMYAEPGNLIGPGPSTGICSLLAGHVSSAERGENPAPFRLSSRGDARDYLDVRDAVRAYLLLLLKGKPGQVYPVISGQERTLGEIADLLISYAKADIPLTWGAPSSGPGGASSSGNESRSSLKELGWEPKIPFSSSILDVLNDHRHKQKGGCG